MFSTDREQDNGEGTTTGETGTMRHADQEQHDQQPTGVLSDGAYMSAIIEPQKT